MSDDLLDKLARKDPKAAARLRKAGAAIVHAPGQLVLVRGNGGDGHADAVGNGAAPPPEGPGPHAPLDDGPAWEAEADDGRPVLVTDPGNIERNIDAARKVLNAAPFERSLFQRGEAAVVVRRTVEKEKLRDGRHEATVPAGTVLLRRAEEEHVSYALHQLCRVERTGRKGLPRPDDLTARFARLVLKNADFRPLLRVVTAPTLRRDGSLLGTPGYDPASGLVYAPDMAYPAVPARPTLEDARAALARLRRPFRAFPFVTPVDEAVILAELLSVQHRQLFACCPGFVHRAAEAGTGKTLLADMVSVIATGAEATNVAAAVLEDREELRKLLTTWTLAGTALGLFDNVARGRVLDVPELNRFVTARLYGDRLLGGNDKLEAPVVTVPVLTGNQIDAKGDASRRFLISDLDAAVERPETRRFDFDALAECRRDRGELVVAGLVLVRAYAAAGSPAVKAAGGEFGSFEEWSRRVRNPLIWAGAKDPVLALEKTRGGDEERATLGEVLAALHAAFPPKPDEAASRWFATQQAIDVAAADAATDDRLMAALGSVAKGKTEAVSPARLGLYLKAHRGRMAGGFRLVPIPDTHTKRPGYVVEPCGGVRRGAGWFSPRFHVRVRVHPP